MSRESDLHALQSMRDEIIEIYNLSEQCKKLSDECEALSSKINSPKSFTFTGKIANVEQKLKSAYDNEWENIQKSGGKLWRIPLIINTVIVSVISFIIISDCCFKTGIFIKDEVLSAFSTSPSDMIEIIIFTAALGFVQIYVPWRIARKGSLK